MPRCLEWVQQRTHLPHRLGQELLRLAALQLRCKLVTWVCVAAVWITVLDREPGDSASLIVPQRRRVRGSARRGRLKVLVPTSRSFRSAPPQKGHGVRQATFRGPHHHHGRPGCAARGDALKMRIFRSDP